MIEALLGVFWCLVIFGPFAYLFYKATNLPDDLVIKQHYDKDDFDAEFTVWEEYENPRYAANIFQTRWFYKGKRVEIKNVRKRVREWMKTNTNKSSQLS